MTKEFPIEKKILLTIQEASIYSGIGTKKLYEMTDDPYCPFLCKNGNHKMIKRVKFEEYLTNDRLTEI